MPTRRAFLAASAAALAGPVRADETADARTAPLDRLMTTFLADHGVPGGSLAVARGGRLVYARGFGHADPDRRTPVRSRSLFRIASVSKPLTAVAVLQLVDAGRVGLDDPILRHVTLRPHLAPGVEADPRLAGITVRHCLTHTAGWDRDRSGDPIGMPVRIANALGTAPPVSPADVARYTLGRPLDFAPGERFAYSNVGYLLLGRLVENVSGIGYERYVRERVLAPVGATAARLCRALPEDRPADEVRYRDARGATGLCLYPPRDGKRVPFPDGAGNVEGYEAHGGWIASATDLVRFAAAFDDPDRCPLLTPRSARVMWELPGRRPGYALGWSVRRAGGGVNAWHNGLISGTSALLVHRHDGLSWAVLFNTDRSRDGRVLSDVIDPLVHRAADAVTGWPDGPRL